MCHYSNLESDRKMVKLYFILHCCIAEIVVQYTFKYCALYVTLGCIPDLMGEEADNDKGLPGNEVPYNLQLTIKICRPSSCY